MKNEHYRKWISQHTCCMCGWANWTPTGEPVTYPSHVRTYGASGKDEGNLLPMCRNCHTGNGPEFWQKERNLMGGFENWPRQEKERLLFLANRYWKEYQSLLIPKPPVKPDSGATIRF